MSCSCRNGVTRKKINNLSLIIIIIILLHYEDPVVCVCVYLDNFHVYFFCLFNDFHLDANAHKVLVFFFSSATYPEIQYCYSYKPHIRCEKRIISHVNFCMFLSTLSFVVHFFLSSIYFRVCVCVFECHIHNFIILFIIPV